MADDVEDLRRKADHLVRSLSTHLDALASNEYPTGSPKGFIDFLRSILRGFDRRLRDDLDQATAQSLCEFLVQLGHHVKFLETASYPRIPWALISPIEKVIARLVPGARVILRSDWEYNYSILRVTEIYRRAFEPMRTYFEDSVFADPAPAWNIVSLPMIDRANILMHVVLGHEIGHRLAEQFLDGEDRTELQRELGELVDDGKWADPNIEKSGPLFAIRAKRDLYDRILELRTRGLKELISDMVGGRLFGLSLLFGMREFSLDDVLDTPPGRPGYYPPWRYRFRLLVGYFVARRHADALQSVGGRPVVLIIRDAAIKEFESIRQLTLATTDIDEINRNQLTQKAYGSIAKALTRVGGFLDAALQGLEFDLDSMSRTMPELLSRISLGVPPAEQSGVVVDFRDAILAGALYKTARLSIPYDPDPQKGKWSLEDDVTLSRLIHKAIEYTNLASEFRDWQASRPRENA